MHSQLTESEIELMEAMSDPTAMTECLIPESINSPQSWPNCQCLTLRDYQFAMQNYSYLIADDPQLSQVENFKLKKASGDLYSIGSRNTGKSMFLIIDVVLSFIHNCKEGCVASVSFDKLKKVAWPICKFIESHKFAKIFHLNKETTRSKTVKRDPLTVNGEHGAVILSVNEKVAEDNPGVQFQGKHFDIRWSEEFSYSSKQGQQNAEDAEMSYGHIERPSGIPDLHIDSPLGKILKNKKLKNWLWKLPQYCIGEHSKILMSDYSTKNIEDMSIGDRILTVPEKKPFRIIEATVLNKMYNGVKNTVLLENGINKLPLTLDHKIFTRTNGYNKKWKSWLEYKDKYLAYSIPNYVRNYKQYYEGMFLGFLECEGSFKRNKREFSIGQKSEKETLEFLLNYLSIEYTKYADNKIENFEYFYLKVSNRDYIYFLYDNLKLSYDRLLGFLIGFVIGDGCVHFNPKTAHRDLTIAQKNKCDILEEVLKLLNVRYSKVRHSTGIGCYNYIISYLDLPIYAPFSKKGIKYQNMVHGQSLLGFRRTKCYVKQEQKLPVWDLTTTAGSFIANGFVVHNCREDWTDEVEDKKAEFYGGRMAAGYKLNVEAEELEGAFNFFDIARFKESSYYKTGRIKSFEIGKETFEGFENRLHIERMPGSEQIYVCADIGTGSAPTEIIIIFFDGKIFKYTYNVTLYRLIQDEQYEIFKWIYDKLEAAYIAIDATHDGGVIIDMLRKNGIDEDHLLKVKFNENIDVDFERDEDDELLMDDNNEPIMKQANTESWSFSELEKIFYGSEFKTPPDAKLEDQVTNVICKRAKLKTLYDSKGANHLTQAFQVFAICKFFNMFNVLKRQYKKVKRAWCS